MKESIIKYILLLTLVQVGHHAAGADIVDTAFINSLLRHGRSLHYTDPDSALYYYRLIIEDKRQKDIKPDPGLDGLAKAYLGTVIRAQDYSGDIYYYNDEYKRAESYYQSSLDIARAGGFNEFTANSVYNVGYIHYVTNNYDRAAELFMESYHIFSETENDQGMFDAIQACALAQRHLGNQELADSCYRKAFDLAGIIGDSLQVADVRLNNGILLCEQGNLEEGTRYFEEALRYYENHGDNEAVSLALLNIGVVMKMIGEYEKAESYIKRSANISETLQQKSQLVVRYYNLADLYMEMGKLETAFDYCQKTMEVAGEIGTRPFNTECNLLLGKYYYQLAEYNQAESYFRSAADSVKNSSDKPLMAHVQLWYARNCLKSGRPARAIELAEESVRLSDDHQLLMNRKEAALVLSQACEKSGDPLSALRWFKLFREIINNTVLCSVQYNV